MTSFWTTVAVGTFAATALFIDLMAENGPHIIAFLQRCI
jgi:hypothetical protein